LAAYYDTSSGEVNVAIKAQKCMAAGVRSANGRGQPSLIFQINQNVIQLIRLNVGRSGRAVFIVSAYGLSFLKLKPFMGKVLRERS
jgi:hypothetical protein